MLTFNVEILNPKAQAILQNLADLQLITLKEEPEYRFLEVIQRMRSQDAEISLEDITKEVESVRSERHGNRKA